MRCTACNRPMTALLLSYVCDYCDGVRTIAAPHRGYVVYRGGRDGKVRLEYVFRSRSAASRWRSLKNLEEYEIREVASTHEFRWRLSSGPVKDLELADHLFEVFPDQKYEPAPYRAHLA